MYSRKMLALFLTMLMPATLVSGYLMFATDNYFTYILFLITALLTIIILQIALDGEWWKV